MPLRTVLVVMVRLTGWVLMVQAVLTFSGYVLQSLRGALADLTPDTVILLNLQFLPGLALALFGEGLVLRLVPPVRKQEAEPVSELRLQQIGFSLIGVYLLYLGSWDLISLLLMAAIPGVRLLDMFRTGTDQFVRLVVLPALSWLFGLYLLVGAPGLSQTLVRWRNRDSVRAETTPTLSE